MRPAAFVVILTVCLLSFVEKSRLPLLENVVGKFHQQTSALVVVLKAEPPFIGIFFLRHAVVTFSHSVRVILDSAGRR